GTLILRSGKMRSHVEMDSILSRESAFLFNNLFFLVAAATVFLGTLYPLLMETLKTAKVSVGPPYYNAVFMPVALGLLILMGVAPSIPWRKASTTHFLRNFLGPFLFAAAITLIIWLSGIRTVFGVAGTAIVSFVAAAIALDFGKITALWAGRHNVNYLSAFLKSFSNNQRRSAGQVTHIGVLVLVTGVIASSVYQTEHVVRMKIGDELSLGPYTVRMVGLRDVAGPNWNAAEGTFDVFRGPRFITQMLPQKRIYTESQTPTTESAIHAVNLGHLFLTMPDVDPDGVTVRALINPLILLVWIGGGIMGLGVILNVFRPKKND
ncbi:MAG TPA: cytochrome c-type biogenesis CcmF C-terminal domain-containing protein, partial [Nitrospiria bacterium]